MSSVKLVLTLRDMYSLNVNFIQKRVSNLIRDIQDLGIIYGYDETKSLLFPDPLDNDLYRYEVTVTYNRDYWSMSSSMQAVPQVIADILKPIIRLLSYDIWIDYCVEYHQDGYPHIHCQIHTKYEILPDIQHQIKMRLLRRYGITQWYQTGKEDKFHEKSQMLWSGYLKKDIEKNQANGMRHYFRYYIANPKNNIIW